MDAVEAEVTAMEVEETAMEAEAAVSEAEEVVEIAEIAEDDLSRSRNSCPICGNGQRITVRARCDPRSRLGTPSTRT
jgi:ribosomal protein S27AE